jgi:hypothetical protein
MLKPKSLLLIAAFIITLTLFGGTSIFGQNVPARDLYTEHVLTPSAGRPGAMVTIELERAGRVFIAGPDFQFRSGDRIRLRLNINFNGYAALINGGTTGKKTLLFPERGERGDLFAAGEVTVPETGWMTFDDNPGIEKLVMVFSSNPIFGRADYPGLANLYDAGANNGTRVASRDLFTEYADNAGYYVLNGTGLAGISGFELSLKHR